MSWHQSDGERRQKQWQTDQRRVRREQQRSRLRWIHDRRHQRSTAAQHRQAPCYVTATHSHTSSLPETRPRSDLPCSLYLTQAQRHRLKLPLQFLIKIHPVTLRHKSNQPCIPLGSLNRVPASAGVKGGILTCVGWQVTLCDPIWHMSFL